jgi:Mn-dependent DtxR family transcriptional regulator
VELTKAGANIGKEMHRRHEILNRFLTDILKIGPDVADSEGCKMEHALSIETLDRLTKFIEFIQACPRTGKSWLSILFYQAATIARIRHRLWFGSASSALYSLPPS